MTLRLSYVDLSALSQADYERAGADIHCALALTGSEFFTAYIGAGILSVQGTHFG